MMLGVSVGVGVGVSVGVAVGVLVGDAVGVGVGAAATRRYSSLLMMTRDVIAPGEISPDTESVEGTVPITPPPVPLAINLWSPAATATPPLLTTMVTTLPLFRVIEPVPFDVVTQAPTDRRPET